MDTDLRNQKLAAALAAEFESCHGLLTGALAHVTQRGALEPWELRTLVGLSRTTAQLAAIISKLTGKPSQKNFENGGSIQQ